MNLSKPLNLKERGQASCLPRWSEWNRRVANGWTYAPSKPPAGHHHTGKKGTNVPRAAGHIFGSNPQQIANESCTIAACFFGMLPRWSSKTRGTSCSTYDEAANDCKEDRWLVEHVSYPTFAARVLDANPGCQIDTFVHTHSVGASDLIQHMYKPRKAAFGWPGDHHISDALPELGWPRDSKPGMFASIEKVLELKREAEVEQRRPYTWVIVLRIDFIFFTDLLFGALRNDLLYLENYCGEHPPRHTPSPAFVERLASQGCRYMAPSKQSINPVPDMFFIANSELMDYFFLNMTHDVEHGCLDPPDPAPRNPNAYNFRASSNHAILWKRFWALRLWHRVGRVTCHHEFVRAKGWEAGGRLACSLFKAGVMRAWNESAVLAGPKGPLAPGLSFYLRFAMTLYHAGDRIVRQPSLEFVHEPMGIQGDCQLQKCEDSCA